MPAPFTLLMAAIFHHRSLPLKLYSSTIRKSPILKNVLVGINTLPFTFNLSVGLEYPIPTNPFALQYNVLVLFDTVPNTPPLNPYNLGPSDEALYISP